MRMSYSGNTSAFQAEARGSIPLIRLNSKRSNIKASCLLASAWKAEVLLKTYSKTNIANL